MEIISVRTLIVTYQIKYRDYLRNVQIERAKNKIFSSNDGSKMKLSNNPNDYRRLIKEEVITKEKKVKTQDSNFLNDSKEKEKFTYKYSSDDSVILEEEKYDGYYGITTNLNSNIEENFRILKSDFESGDIYLSREDRITAHFLTCFISLLIYRILENKLDYKYTNTQIIEKSRKMEVYEEKGIGYSPAYVGDNLTDHLHDKFSFRTDYEIIIYEKFNKIFKQIKK